MRNPSASPAHHEEALRLFRMNGTTLRRWSLANGFDPATVARSLRGEQNGPRAYEARRRVHEAISAFPYTSDVTA